MFLRLLFFLFINSALFSQVLPDWFIPLRESIYEQQLNAEEIAPLYEATKERANTSLSGAELYIMLSRIEYMMGRAYQFENRNNAAADRYAAGIDWAEKALEIQHSSEAWQMLAENISQSCAVRGTAYAMTNGLRVERYARNALEHNPRNAAAQYMIAARWVFAPSPFHNYRRGIQMMEAIITEGDMQKDDEFNVYSAIAYTYIQQRRFSDARPWLLKSLEIYPSNRFVQNMLEQT